MMVFDQKNMVKGSKQILINILNAKIILLASYKKETVKNNKVIVVKMQRLFKILIEILKNISPKIKILTHIDSFIIAECYWLLHAGTSRAQLQAEASLIIQMQFSLHIHRAYPSRDATNYIAHPCKRFCSLTPTCRVEF